MSSQTHALTGLPTRARLENDLKQALSSEESCALALSDMDHFRELNDELGSEAGDALLKDVAALLSAAQPGAAYHIGGDEFALLLRNVSLEQAFLTMEQLRVRIQQASTQLVLADGAPITATLGVAQFPRDASDARTLWSKASAALQAAKENGRNTVSLPPNEEMVMKSCYYPASSTRKLNALAKRLGRKESPLLREALDDLFRKYDLQTQ